MSDKIIWSDMYDDIVTPESIDNIKRDMKCDDIDEIIQYIFSSASLEWEQIESDMKVVQDKPLVLFCESKEWNRKTRGYAVSALPGDRKLFDLCDADDCLESRISIKDGEFTFEGNRHDGPIKVVARELTGKGVALYKKTYSHWNDFMGLYGCDKSMWDKRQAFLEKIFSDPAYSKSIGWGEEKSKGKGGK